MYTLVLKPDFYADVFQVTDRIQQVHRVAGKTADRLDEHDVDAPGIAVCDEAIELASLFGSGNIVAYWWAVDEAVKTAIEMRIPQKVGCVHFEVHSGMLFITLPSGRRLAYVKPRIGENKFGGKSVTYMGIDAQKKWSRIESYGPKFVENIVQAVSRDILAYAMRTLSHCFICGHVHDELIIECDPQVSLDAVCEQMGRTPPWLPGIELRADGYECAFYQKQ